MTTTILTDEQVVTLAYQIDAQPEITMMRQFARAVEQAVLQSDEAQALRKDAERYRSWRAALCTENRDWMQRVQADMQRECIASGKDMPGSHEVDRAIDSALEKQP